MAASEGGQAGQAGSTSSVTALAVERAKAGNPSDARPRRVGAGAHHTADLAYHMAEGPFDPFPATSIVVALIAP